METKYKIHASYIFSILITTIVFLVTVKWGEIPELVQYITFALTVTSLVLALLAIIYAFYSSTSVSQNIATLSGLSQEIAESSESLGVATTALAVHVDALPTHLKLVAGKVDETQSLLKQVYAKQISVPETKQSVETGVVTTKMVETFMVYSSEAGIESVYACCLAFEKKKIFQVKDLCEKTKLTDAEYAYGYIIATVAASLMNATRGKSGEIAPTSVNDVLLSKIKAELNRRAQKKEQKDKDSFLAKIVAIETYIEQLPAQG